MSRYLITTLGLRALGHLCELGAWDEEGVAWKDSWWDSEGWELRTYYVPGIMMLDVRLSLASSIMMTVTWQGLNQHLCKRKRKEKKKRERRGGGELVRQSEVTFAQRSIPHRTDLAQILAWSQADYAVEKEIQISAPSFLEASGGGGSLLSASSSKRAGF